MSDTSQVLGKYIWLHEQMKRGMRHDRKRHQGCEIQKEGQT